MAKPNGKPKRDKLIGTHVTVEEKAKIEEAAYKVGPSVSYFLLQAALEKIENDKAKVINATI